MLATLAALLVLVPLCVLVPGFALVRRRSLPEELRLPVSIAVSLAVLYGVGFGLWFLEAGTAAYVAVAVAIAAGAAALRRDLRSFVRSPAIRDVLLQYAIFAAWVLLLSLVVRCFSGGAWASDWEEHYQRALFFCGGVPLDTRFIDTWPLTARPPLNNVVVAFFMKIAGTEFAAYQVAAVLVGSLEFLGAAALLLAIAGGSRERRRPALLVLTALLALNPSVVQNVTYAWTRPLTNFLVLTGAALFVVALRERSPALRRWSYLHLGLALATHYSTVPYLLALALVEAWFVMTRRLALSEAALGAAIGVAPSIPWLAFALDHFGVAGTFLTNSTATGTARVGLAEQLLRSLGNLGATLVPHPLREVPPLFAQDWALGYARDWAFLIYQVSLPALMGSLGWLAVAWLLATDALGRIRQRRVETPALVATFVAAAVVLGIASVAQEDAFGLAHVCLQPIAIAGLVYLAARWREAPAWLRAAAGLGLLVDAAVGIALHFWVQHLTMADLVALNPARAAVSRFHVANLAIKVQAGRVFLADSPERVVAIALALAALVTLLALAALRARAEDRRPARAG